MAGLSGGSSGHNFDYVQDSEPAADPLETWLDTSVSPAEAKILSESGNWNLLTTTEHSELGGVQEDNHHNPVSVGDGLTIDSAQSLGLVIANALKFDADGNLAVDESGINISNIADVAGLTSIDVDTSGNRPTAGTADRIYIETDTGRVLYDDGSAWIQMGVSDHSQLSGIGAADHHDPVDVGDGLTVDSKQNIGLSVANALKFVNGDLAVDESGISHSNIADVNEGDHRTQDQVEDIVGNVIGGAGNISVSYDDANGVLTVDTSALNHEQVEDVVANLVTNDSNLTVSYDDANGTLTVGLADSISVQSADITGELGIPQYSDPSSGQSNTSEGEIFYAQSDNSLYLNDGA